MTITPRALLARLNRRLAKDGRQIIGKAGQLNSYALVDEAKGEVIDPAPDLEAMAREMGALRSWEVVDHG
jgi:hypothetical protein